MTRNLDDQKRYELYDKEDIEYGIDHMPEQFLRALKDMESWHLPSSYKNSDRIILAGMGGSHLAMRMIQGAMYKQSKKSIEIISDYSLPGYVNKKTLIILSSFSGTTEEILEIGRSLQKQSAKVVVITAGGPLAVLAKKNKWPLYQFIPGELAKQPRLGLGFSFVGMMHVLKACGACTYTKKQIHSMVNAMLDVIDICASDVKTKENPAKQVAQVIAGRPVLLVGAEHLIGNAHILQNQINETAKSYCHYQVLPDLNHHFLESLVYPEGFFKEWVVLMLVSHHYHKRTQKRFALTADIFEKQGGEVIEYETSGATTWEEVAEVLQFGSYVSFYQAILHGVEPQYIPFVNELKKKMN